MLRTKKLHTRVPTQPHSNHTRAHARACVRIQATRTAGAEFEKTFAQRWATESDSIQLVFSNMRNQDKEFWGGGVPASAPAVPPAITDVAPVGKLLPRMPLQPSQLNTQVTQQQQQQASTRKTWRHMFLFSVGPRGVGMIGSSAVCGWGKR